jgi:hypothetical protein
MVETLVAGIEMAMTANFKYYSMPSDREEHCLPVDSDAKYLDQLFSLIAIARRRGNLRVVEALQDLCFRVISRQRGVS